MREKAVLLLLALTAFGQASFTGERATIQNHPTIDRATSTYLPGQRPDELPLVSGIGYMVLPQRMLQQTRRSPRATGATTRLNALVTEDSDALASSEAELFIDRRPGAC